MARKPKITREELTTWARQLERLKLPRWDTQRVAASYHISVPDRVIVRARIKVLVTNARKAKCLGWPEYRRYRNALIKNLLIATERNRRFFWNVNRGNFA